MTEEIRMCGLPDALVLGLEVRRNAQARWFLAGDLAGIGRDKLRAAIAEAFRRWSAVSGCTGTETTNPAEADLVIQTVPLDGPSSVLADCELPGPRVQRMRVDTTERWTLVDGPGVPSNQIDLTRVLTHELGHFWGVGHISAGNLMAPTYSTRIDRPVRGDTAEMVARYGPPVVVSPTQPPSAGEPITIRIWGADRIEIPGYKVTKE